MRCGDTVRSVTSSVLRAWYSSQSFWRLSVADATVVNAAPAPVRRFRLSTWLMMAPNQIPNFALYARAAARRWNASGATAP